MPWQRITNMNILQLEERPLVCVRELYIGLQAKLTQQNHCSHFEYCGGRFFANYHSRSIHFKLPSQQMYDIFA